MFLFRMAFTKVDLPALRSPVTRILDEVSRTRDRRVERWESEDVRRRESSIETVESERDGRREGREGLEGAPVGEVLRSMERMDNGWEEPGPGVEALGESTSAEKDFSCVLTGNFFPSFFPTVEDFSDRLSSPLPTSVVTVLPDLDLTKVEGEELDWLEIPS